MSNIKLTMLIVNYKSRNNLLKLLKSSQKYNQKYISNTIIVNNDSSERIKLNNKNINIINNKKNIGFSAAVNQGIKISNSDYILLVNPDCYFVDSSLVELINTISVDNSIAAVGGSIYRPSGELSYSATSKPNFFTALFEFTNLKKIFPKNYYSYKFWMEKYTNKDKYICESICGAFMLFRRVIAEKINYFDNSYFMYLEDLDFGNKCKKLGYKCVFVKKAKIFHIGGGSSNNKYKTLLKEWYKSRKIFFKKHLSPVQWSIMSIVFLLEEVLLNIYHNIKNESAY